MKPKKLGKLLDSGLDYLALRIAQTAQRQGVPVWSYYAGRTDSPQWDRLVVALAEFLAKDGWPITDYGDDRPPDPPHAEQFGSFAIGIDPISARALGMGPVSYIYPAEPPGSTNITIEILRNLWEIRSLALIVSMMEWEAKTEGHKPIDPGKLLALMEKEKENEGRGSTRPEKLRARDYYTDEVERKWSQIKSSSQKSIRNALSYLDFVRMPAWSLADSIHLALCFYQVTDQDGPLRNFQLREWRIPQFSHDEVVLTPLCRAVGRLNNLRIRLKELGWDEEYIEKCWIFEKFRGEKFFAFVNEVICPTCVADNVQKLLTGFGFSPFKGCVPNGVELVVFQRPA